MGNVKLLDHYHTFLFYVNLTDLQNGYQHLLSNQFYLRPNSTSDKLTRKLFHQLSFNILQIEEVLNKLDYKRTKRGLFNIIGKAIKFVAGNPDNDDLKVIEENFNKIYQDKNSEIQKINRLTSLANHLTNRLAEDTRVMNENMKNTKLFLQTLKSVDEIRTLLINEIYQAEGLLNKLLMIERTITLSYNNVPNLELIRIEELLSIHDYLKKLYDSRQLQNFDNVHLFKILESAKVITIGIEQAITFLLKIPILNPYLANYSRIYPLPNAQDVAIIPPRKYLIEVNNQSYWTNEDCHIGNSFRLCEQQPIQENCTLHTLEKCPTIKITNDYKITYPLKNRQLLVLSKTAQTIVENCHGLLHEKSIQGINLVSSNCKIIVGSTTYENTVPTFKIDVPNIQELNLSYNHQAELHLRHFQFPDDLLMESKELVSTPLYLHPLTQLIHYGTTGTIVIMIVIFCLLGLMFKTRIMDLFCMPRRIIRIRKTQQPPESNEDVEAKGERS